MDIVLDSNIYRKDLSLRSKDFEVIVDYLTKTDSQIILPQIILDEILGLYQRILLERINSYKNSIYQLNLALPNVDSQISYNNIDIDKELIYYENFVKEKLKILPRNVLPYNNSHLPDVAKRLIYRKKPSGKDGQGFRDTLIWLVIKDFTKNQAHNNQIILIGDDSSDFSDNVKNELHPLLVEECNELEIKILYYRSIKDFVEEHSIKINFITIDWLYDNIDLQVTDDLLKHKLESNANLVYSAITSRNSVQLIHDFTIQSISLVELLDFFVYEKLDNQLIVNVGATYDINLEYDNLYFFDENAEQLFMDTVKTNLTASLYLSLVVENKKIVDYNVEDVTLD